MHNNIKARVGNTYGERQQAEQAKQTANNPQSTESTGFFKRLREIGDNVRDFFNVEHNLSAAAFQPNAKFLAGANVHPLKALASIEQKRPAVNDQKLFADLDQIKNLLDQSPRAKKR